jgi:hypothetical protein
MGCDGKTCRLVDPPSGWDGIVKLYGDIRQYIKEDGTLDPSWESKHLAYVSIPWRMVLAWNTSIRVRRIRCHVEIQELLQHIVHVLDAKGLGAELSHFGGCFNFRPQRGSHKLSLHSWGVAVDWNPATNRMGTKGNMNPAIVREFDRHGWTWGGRFSRPDGMHFQFAKGY